MKIMINFIFLINYFIISFCTFGCGATKYEISSKEKAVNKVMGRNSKSLGEKYCMCPFAITVAMPGGDIRYLELEFQIHGPLTKNEMRKILINSIHDLLSDINSDTSLCSYLKNHFLNVKDVGIKLFLIDSTGLGLKEPDIGIASISNAELEYKIMAQKYDSVMKMDIPYIKSSSIETYEEALQILQSQ